MDKVIGTLIGVVVAIGVSGLIFIGVNLLFDTAPKRWQLFTTLIGTGVGLLTFLILWGNLLVTPEFLGNKWVDMLILVAVGAAAGGVVGFLLATAEDARTRLALGLAGGGGLGLLAGIWLVDTSLLEIDWLAAVVWTVGGAALGAAIWWVSQLPAATGRLAGLGLGGAIGLALGIADGAVLAVVVTTIFGAFAGYLLSGRSRPTLLAPVVFYATLGWLIGAIVVAGVGTGTRVESILALALAGAGFGALAALKRIPTTRERDGIALRARSWIFLGPAIAFIAMTLVVPTVRTIILSFKDSRGGEWVGGENYQRIFTDPEIFEVSKWTDIFTSVLFWAGVVLIAIGIVAGRLIGRRTGHAFELSGGTGPPLVLGVFLLAFGIFSVLRGTIFNNLWWVFTVTLLATGLGLAIAVLADRAKYESVAKSIIFLPMAISFVGAGIIWRFMYIARPETKEQTGVFNALWVGLGKLSNSGWPKALAVALLLGLVAGFLYLAYRGWKANATGLMGGTIFAALPLLWLVYRLLGPGLGGSAVNSSGEVIADTILFMQESPMNNVWLMVVLIWIQAGFAMVIFSAAIKGVPADLIEAAKVDGATESQTFWRVIIPQIATTIGVVITTLIVLVMKVFDIVKVMTNGNFGTQVLANEMWQRAFTEFNFGLGAAVAIVLFISVLPVMYINIRRMQKAVA